ncbi:MAG TPA: flagellar biosynthesis protein FliQ [Candidatus Tenderia sp.]|nr:flagellar biosynthesis protein FliQ [Candidatus Tenderia sp.]
MTPDTVIGIARHALEITIIMVSVILLPALAVGLLVAVFQAATQVNETTLSFIPKLLTTFAVLIYAGPWLLRVIMEYITALFSEIPGVIG